MRMQMLANSGVSVGSRRMKIVASNTQLKYKHAADIETEASCSKNLRFAMSSINE